MTEAQELKAAAIRDARQKIASGEWSITPSQLAMFRKMSLGRVTAVNSTHLAAIKSALKDLLRATKSRDLEIVLSLVQSAIVHLRGLEPGATEAKAGEELTVPQAIKEIAARQADMDAKLDRRERLITKLLAETSLAPPPAPEKLMGRAIKKAMKKVDAEVRPDAKESPETTRRRRWLTEEIARGKRR